MNFKNIAIWTVIALAVLFYVVVLTVEVALDQLLLLLLTGIAGSIICIAVQLLAKVPFLDLNVWKDERLIRHSATASNVALGAIILLLVLLTEYGTLANKTFAINEVFWSSLMIVVAVKGVVYSALNFMG